MKTHPQPRISTSRLWTLLALADLMSMANPVQAQTPTASTTKTTSPQLADKSGSQQQSMHSGPTVEPTHPCYTPQKGVAELRVQPARPATATLQPPSGSRQGANRLRTGQQLLILVPDVNPFMHEVVIQGQAMRYELATPTVSEGGGKATPILTRDSAATAPKTDKMKSPVGPDKAIKQLDGEINQYLDALDELRLAYGASTWPLAFVAARLRALHDYAKATFGTSAPSARQLAG